MTIIEKHTTIVATQNGHTRTFTVLYSNHRFIAIEVATCVPGVGDTEEKAVEDSFKKAYPEFF